MSDRKTIMTWDQFEQMLIRNGWNSTEAKAEREALEHGYAGDCDGDLDVITISLI